MIRLLVLSVLVSTTMVLAVPLKIRTGHKIATFEVELARTEAEHARGLMHRTTLAPNAGMLFVYKAPRILSMWMKNTHLSLDMLFIDQAGQVIFIKKKATPFSEEAIFCPTLAQAVLEVPGGTCDQLGIVPNTSKLMLSKPLTAFLSASAPTSTHPPQG